MDFFDQFGVQPILLLAQVVNFFILLFLLNKFLYRPILKVLDERRAKISESLAQAEEIEANLLKTELDRDKKLAKAGQEAAQIIELARLSATEIIAEAHQKAAEDIENLLEKTRQELAAERQTLHRELRAEFADMLVSSLEKVTTKTLSDSDRRKLAKEAVAQL